MNNSLHHALALLADGKNLPRELAERLFQIIMNGGATPAQMGAILLGLRAKGETMDELAAGATALRAKAPRVRTPEGAIDTCGTGGDGRGTQNISTAAAFVLAACGVPVTKHGNRSVSSRSGSADVLAALGVRLDADIPVLERCLAECNICFLMAPRFHTAMRHVAPVRQELGMRTIFNLLGPLANPATPPFQLLGVYSPNWLEPMASALRSLGTKAAWVVHGDGGLDELSLSGPSQVIELKNGELRRFEITPEDAGLARSPSDALSGGTPEENAAAMQQALSGVSGPYRDAAILNAAAGLVIAGRATTLKEGAQQAAQAIDSGTAFALIRKLAHTSSLSS